MPGIKLTTHDVKTMSGFYIYEWFVTRGSSLGETKTGPGFPDLTISPMRSE
ncbi:MAG: hypothetical protein PVH64_06975 [Bacillota bacterium]